MDWWKHITIGCLVTLVAEQLLYGAILAATPSNPMNYDLCVHHALVIDGTGSPGYRANLFIREGRIVNITSISVKKPVLGLDLSSGARAGLTAFLAGVSRSLASSNVTINNILPGFFDTDRLQGSLEASVKTLGITMDEAVAARTQQVPAARFGQPEEFGEACAFLCSLQAGYITGQNLLLDGGVFDSAF